MKLDTNNLYHKFVRFFQRISLKLYKLMKVKDESPKSGYEYECVSISKSLINNQKTKLLISPISKKRYIHSHDKQIFIIMDNGDLTIVNHMYSYTIQLNFKSYDRLAHMFDHEVEKRRQEMESEIKSNVKHSLSNIYQNILNENK